jgi:hypothetical protein
MRLKKSLLMVIALAASGMATAEVQGDYCDGYKDGYRQGYTQVAGAGPTPLSPLCPMKSVRPEGEKRSEYERGFQKGLKDGIRDGSR